MRFDEKEYVNEHLVVEDKKVWSGFGSNTLTGCTIDIKESASNWGIGKTGSTFIDCQINFKKQQKNQRLFNGKFVRCTFKGSYSGDWGNWPNNGLSWKGGGLIDCDFRQATLDGCRFFGETPGSLSFDKNLLPRWPHVFFFRDEFDIDMIRKLDWPKESRITISIAWRYFLGDENIPEMMALSHHWTAKSKNVNGEENLEIIRRNLEKCGVFM